MRCPSIEFLAHGLGQIICQPVVGTTGPYFTKIHALDAFATQCRAYRRGRTRLTRTHDQFYNQVFLLQNFLRHDEWQCVVRTDKVRVPSGTDMHAKAFSRARASW